MRRYEKTLLTSTNVSRDRFLYSDNYYVTFTRHSEFIHHITSIITVFHHQFVA